MVTNYFFDIFSSQAGNSQVIIDAIDRKIFEEMNNELNASFTIEEVKIALFQMQLFISPSSDNMPLLFF